MRVLLHTAHVDAVELTNGRLTANLTDGREVLLLHDAQDFCVARRGAETHIVAFDQQGAAWHFRGEDSFVDSRLELEHEYGRGSVLVTDGGGQLHLIYLTSPRSGQGAALCHQVFGEQWSKPMVICTHVRPDRWGFSACWEPGGFLHLAYLSHGDGFLLYRAYTAAHKMWSGAVPLVKQPCRSPLFFPGPPLLLAWIVEGKPGEVQMMAKGETWSRPRSASRSGGACSGLGWGTCDGEVLLFWRQGEKLWRLAVEGKEGPEAVESPLYTSAVQVAVGSSGESVTVPVYIQQTVSPPSTAPAAQEPQRAPEPAVEEHPSAAGEGQEGAVEHVQPYEKIWAEQTAAMQRQWETMRRDCDEVRELLKALEDRLDAEARSLSERLAGLPKPKLESIVQRIERVEIRLTKLERDLRDWQMNVERRAAALEQAGLAVSRRLSALENPQSESRPSFWSRLWRW